MKDSEVEYIMYPSNTREIVHVQSINAVQPGASTGGYLTGADMSGVIQSMISHVRSGYSEYIAMERERRADEKEKEQQWWARERDWRAREDKRDQERKAEEQERRDNANIIQPSITLSGIEQL